MIRHWLATWLTTLCFTHQSDAVKSSTFGTYRVMGSTLHYVPCFVVSETVGGAGLERLVAAVWREEYSMQSGVQSRSIVVRALPCGTWSRLADR